MRILNILAFLVILSCARVTVPEGGPRDEQPPELLESNPKNGQKNFQSGTISLTFNEDVKLKDAKDQILVSPAIGKNSTFTAKKRKVIITPEKPWLENTTYTINFREAIQDLNEGNPAENLKLAFSTGNDIDSLSIPGKVKQTFNETIPEKVTVALFQSDTFNIFDQGATYFTMADKNGNFSLENLKSGKYFIYAFQDKNKNGKVESKNEAFDFKVDAITLPGTKDSIELSLTNLDSRKLQITSFKNTDKGAILRFNKSIESFKLKNINKSISTYQLNNTKTEIQFYHQFNKTDSIAFNVIAYDSLEQKLDSTLFLKYTNTKTVKETFKSTVTKSWLQFDKKTYNIAIQVNKPILDINYDSIYVKYDSAFISPINKNNLDIDTINYILNTSVKLPDSLFSGKSKLKPEFILGKGSLISIEQDSSKRIIKPIELRKEEDFGTVLIKVETQEKNYIIQLIQDKNEVVREVSNQKDITFKNLEPKEYKIRIIVDSNANKKWDPGNFISKVQAERTVYYKSDEGKFSFPLRANWELGPLLIKF